MQAELYTVTFRRSMPIKNAKGQDRIQDIIETHYDQTRKGLDALNAKFPGMNFQIEKQGGRLNRSSEVDFGERLPPQNPMPVRLSPEERHRRQAAPVQEPVKQFRPAAQPTKSSILNTGGTYTDLVNEMAKESAS